MNCKLRYYAMGLDEAGAAGERATYDWPEDRLLYPSKQV